MEALWYADSSDLVLKTKFRRTFYQIGCLLEKMYPGGIHPHMKRFFGVGWKIEVSLTLDKSQLGCI